MRGLAWLDVGVLALALPVFLAAGLPLLGWAGVAVTWLVLRVAQDWITRRARATEDPRRSTMILAIGMMARVWILALAIFAVGAIERDAGLSGALLSILVVTAYLVSVFTRGTEGAPGMSR